MMYQASDDHCRTVVTDSACRIFVCFTDADAVLATQFLKKGDIIFGDITSSLPQDVNYISPQTTGFDSSQLFDDIRAFMSTLEAVFGVLVRGFINNFFECSIVPLSRYILGLDTVIKGFQCKGNKVEVVFPLSYYYLKKSSTYYLAEHESQGVRFYKRGAYFLPYLLEVCQRLNVKTTFLRRGGLSPVWGMDILRLVSVFVLRMAAALTTTSGQQIIPACSEKSDLLVLSRTTMQTEFIYPFLTVSGLAASVGVGESFLGRGNNWRLARTLSKGVVCFNRLIPAGPLSVLRRYLRTAVHLILRPQTPPFEVCGISLRLNQAVSELLIMLPELEFYQQSVETWLRRVPSPGLSLILSLEQKSPHAFVDAHVAKKFGLRCFHLMQCDQHAVPLPFPVFGDYFLTDSRVNQQRFQAAWPDCTHQIRYLGTLKALGASVLENIKIDSRSESVWCFFASAVELNDNIEIIAFLQQLCNKTDLKFFIKLHPRDHRSRYRMFPDVEFVTEGSLTRSALYARFTHAITFPSGVVLDLLFANRPFLLMEIGKFRAGRNDCYLDRSYSGVISDLRAIEAKLLNYEQLESDFASYRARFFEANQIVSGVDEILDGFTDLLDELKVWQ